MADYKYDAIAIDGPAASGKSTVARELAQRLGLIMVNSGDMYRAVTLEVVNRGIDPADSAAVVAMLGDLDMKCAVEGKSSVVLLNGAQPGAALRSDAVNAAVSKVASIPEVRGVLVDRQRELLAVGDLVMEGRDIGSVVFPDTPFKIYIDASEEVRRNRRAAEGQKDEVSSRDRQDAARKTSPLVIADGATVIDSSEMTIEQAVDATEEVLREKGWFEREPENAAS